MASKRAIEPESFPFFNYKNFSFCLGLDTDDGVWLSGHSASQYDPDRGRIVVNGDIVAQSRVAYDKIGRLLRAVGLDFSNVVRTIDYVTMKGIEDYPRTADVRREVFGANPPATSVMVVDALLRPEALIEIEVVASRTPNAAANPTWAGADPLHRSAGRRVGNVLYISAVQPVLPGTNQIVAPGDVVAQTRRIYETVTDVLRAAGMGWGNIVKTVEFLTPDALPQYRYTGRVRKEFMEPAYPGATGIIMSRLQHPEAMITVDFIAAEGEREVLNPGWKRYEKLTYVPAVKVGNIVFMAGQGALDPETEQCVHDGDVVAQSRYIYQNMARVLEVAGAGPDAMVKTIEYVTPAGLADYRRTADVRKEIFAQPFPASTGVVCERLLRPEMMLEVDAIAIL